MSSAANGSGEGLDVVSRIKFDCDQCEVQFTRKDNLKKHIRFAHEGIADFSCPVCKKGFMHKRDFTVHCENVHNGTKKRKRRKRETIITNDYETFFCQQCDYNCKHRQQLKIHIESKHEGKRYNCSQCDKKYTQIQDLNKHIKADHEGRRFKCDNCEFVSKTKTDVKRHKNIHHRSPEERIKYICNFCSNVYLNEKYFKKHMKSNHFNGEKVHKCDKCSYTTKYRGFFKQHVEKHQVKIESVIQPYVPPKVKLSCEKCPYTTKRKRDLKLHKKYHHHQVKTKYSCPDCEKLFLDYNEFKVHAKENHRRSGLKCDDCHFVTSRKDRLKAHQKIHVMFKECGQPITEKSLESVTTEDQLFPCHMCDWEASNHALLMKHILQHKNEIVDQLSRDKSKQSDKKIEEEHKHKDRTRNYMNQESKTTKPPKSEPEPEEDNYSISKDGTIWYTDPIFGKIPVIPKPSSEVDTNKDNGVKEQKMHEQSDSKVKLADLKNNLKQSSVTLNLK